MSENVNIRELNELVAGKSQFVDLVLRGMDQTIVGQKHLVESLLIALLANGHVLLEGVPVWQRLLPSRPSHRLLMPNTPEYSSPPTCSPPM